LEVALNTPTWEDIHPLIIKQADHNARIEHLEEYETIQNGYALRLERRFERFEGKFDAFRGWMYKGIIVLLVSVLTSMFVLILR